jgi:hypothetical protein
LPTEGIPSLFAQVPHPDPGLSASCEAAGDEPTYSPAWVTPAKALGPIMFDSVGKKK